MTLLLDEGVPGRHFFLQVEVDANPGSGLNDPDNNVKGLKLNPTYSASSSRIVFPCDCGLVKNIPSHRVGDKDQGVAEKDQVAECLKEVIHEPLFEKATFLTANPIASCDKESDPVVDSLQVELQGQSRRPPGGSQS